MFTKKLLVYPVKYAVRAVIIISLLVLLLEPVTARADVTRGILFPVIGNSHFSNDFYASRPGAPNGIHQATDIIAGKGQQIVSATNATINYVISPEADWGYSIGMTDSQGYKYNYLHMNNDSSGTNDNRGGEMNAYAPDMKAGNHVEAGQLLGYVGDSGYSGGVNHLHFEIYAPDGTPINPYYSLVGAPHISQPSRYSPLPGETLPYWVDFTGGLNLAMGDMDGDHQSEAITSPGYGGSADIKVFNANNALLSEFFAYDQGFRGGADVATGDTNGVGIDEIITGPGPGGGPWVRVFNSSAQLISQFAAYDPEFKGGIKVAAADTNGDGIDEIITAPGPGGGPWIRVFNTSAQLISQFAAFDPGFRGGIDITAGDTAGTTIPEIITAPGPGGGPWVRIFNTSAQVVKDIQVYDLAYKGGVRVSAGDIRPGSPKDEIITIPSDYGESRVRLMSNTGANITDYKYLESWWKGYYDVAAGNGTSRLGTGTNRRASMRNGPN